LTFLTVASKYTSRLHGRESFRFPHHHLVNPAAGSAHQGIKAFTLKRLDHESSVRFQMLPGKLQASFG